jgi:fatty-acid peroxygenase
MMATPSPRLSSALAPRLPQVDSSSALLREGYAFGSRRFEACGSELFQTRLMLKNVLVGFGEDAVRQFYEPDRMARRGALPFPTLSLLLDVGSVEMLDGEDHRWRKEMFLSLMTPASLAEMADLVEQEWRARIPHWAQAGRVVLLDAVHEVLCRAVCAWSGVPLPERDVRRRTDELAALVEGAGAVGPRNWVGQLRRHRVERWARGLVDAVRDGQVSTADGSPLQRIASHRTRDGQLLHTDVAAVELINVLRPTVAVARFVVFAALALHEHPENRDLVADDEHLGWFVQEVRRFYPFFPAVGGRVRTQFEWRGEQIPPGTWMLLDLYATNRDARRWDEPDGFRPERFRTWDGSPFDFVPQGGGDHATTHRCAGEWLTIELVKRAVRLLSSAMRYDVPPQDLTVDLSRMPAVPRSRFVIDNVRASL